MARAAGFVLTLLAGASIALGSPVCCLIGSACCQTKAAVETPGPKHDCCSRCRKEQPETPAPKPCEKKDCTCRHDVTAHAAAAEHVPLVAVFDVAPVALLGSAASDVAAAPTRAAPLAPVRASHPLLL